VLVLTLYTHHPAKVTKIYSASRQLNAMDIKTFTGTISALEIHGNRKIQGTLHCIEEK